MDPPPPKKVHWADFAAYAGLVDLPAEPTTVGAYLADRAACR
jgi:hypothetical protein